MTASKDCAPIKGESSIPTKAKIEAMSLENKLSLEQSEERRTDPKETRQIPVFTCFGSQVFNDSIQVLRFLNCSDIRYFSRKNMDDDGYSIPSEVYLTESSRTNFSSDKLFKVRTFHSVDTTLLSSQQSKTEVDSDEECLLLAGERARKPYHEDETDIMNQRSVSPLTFVSFGGLSFSSKEPNIPDENIVQDLVSAASIIQPNIQSKDSLLSFDVSSVSKGSDAILDALSLDSEDVEDRGITLNEICEQSVQSSTASVTSPEPSADPTSNNIYLL